MVTDNTNQTDETTAFLRAARSGNLERVIEYLETELDINTANSNGLNALHLASKDGHVEVVTELLKKGAKVDAATKKGNTALHIASLAGQSEIVSILIHYGAAVNIQSQNGFTPLYMAAQENHDQVVKLLLSNGANQSLATEDGFTPLAVAMQQGHDKVVSVLLENDSKGKVRLPALHIAAKKDDCKAADLLLQNDHKPDVTSKSGFTPLHIAAHYGNEEIARLLIKRGADVNYLAKHNISPLHVAAKWGKNNMVKILLENSGIIDAKTRDGLTPLHCAARSGHDQVVSSLLENSAPISARTKNGLAPLHMASQGDHVEAARVLLYHRAPVDEVTIDYLTSLHVAAHCGHVRVAKLLLDRKADPNARALNGFTPLHIACKKNRIKVVELLLKHGASIESTTESGLTPLHVASFMGCMNIVIFLLQHEANPDVPTVRGETPLHLAARANQTDIIRILLRNGAKVDARAREEQTPLHIASRLGNIDIVMLLLQHGAAVDTTTKDMYTALHIAAKEGQEEVAAILVENNASVKATTKNGFTPLHVAAKYGNTNVAKILLQKDNKLDAQGKNDITPLHLACHYDHPNVANLLLEKGASSHLASQNGHTPLHIAARKNQMDIASTLLESGADANAKSKAGFTPLHLSAQKGHYDMTNLLIEHGADPNHKAKNGLTALHLCAQEDFIRVASILVKNGANVESQTETGYRPIHVAGHFGNLSMIKFLLKHNADIDVKTNQNYTPLHQAAQQGHAHIATALLEGNASHKARTKDGLTPMNIAQKLGYISVMEVLKGLPYDSETTDNKNWEEKYKVIVPESLQETSFMSDSDDEGVSDGLVSEQPYRYLTADLMKSLRDDSLPIDVTKDDPIHRQVSSEEKQEFTQSNNYCLAENFDTNDGSHLGFLVSFLVDARGGALKGCRHSGVRILIPPRRASMPIRVTCRLVKPNKVSNPPPLMEGEALATRIIEMGPVGVSFLGPVLIDIPHFASAGVKGREIIILRSENGETWKEHDNSSDNDDSLLTASYDPQMGATHSGRITRILTSDFPQYFAIVSRIKQEVHVIGAEGGILISSVANHVQAVFPPGALTKKIKVGLQAHVIPTDLTAKLLGNGVAVSPVITIEPRRRKFHKPITLTIPVPQAANKGMINQYGGETPTLRLLCSIAGGTSEAQWEDVTGSTPLTFMNDKVSFTTTVSARFWLMDCRNISEVPKMATDLYKESLFVPYVTNFVIYLKRMDLNEATLRILCMTDGKDGLHTLERQEEFLEIVKSRDVEALDGKDLYIEFSGNLIPVTKSGVQLKFTFRAFRQNRLSFHMKVKDPLSDPVARMMFMREPKIAKGEPPQQPICVLNIVLPEILTKTDIENKLKEYEDSNIIHQKMDSYESKYKMERKEKYDEPKCTSPSEQKFITDTLQKEQTDAANTIHESFAQKASCPLESVDASYENNEVIANQDLSPCAEKQTYSEKRKFWEDMSRKRDSYQCSESEVSRASQLTINESDSEYLQSVVSEEDDLTEAIMSARSETLEDMNVPDLSECSVAEKAHYFEEQIQREFVKLPNTKVPIIDQITSMIPTHLNLEEKFVIESRQAEKWKEEEELIMKDARSNDEKKLSKTDFECNKSISPPVMEICKELLNKEREFSMSEAESTSRQKISQVEVICKKEDESEEIKEQSQVSKREELDEVTSESLEQSSQSKDEITEELLVQMDSKKIKKEFESRIPISSSKLATDKEKIQPKSKISPPTDTLKTIPKTLESTSPTIKKKEFESRIPKRKTTSETSPTNLSDKTTEKLMKELQNNLGTTTYTVTEKKSTKETTSTIKSKIQTFNEPSLSSSKIDQKITSKIEKKEILSSEIKRGPEEKLVVHEEKEQLEQKESSEMKLVKESANEKTEEKSMKTEEVDKTIIQKTLLNQQDDGKTLTDAQAFQSLTKTEQESRVKVLEGSLGTSKEESGATRIQESNVNVAVRDSNDRIEKLVNEESHKNTTMNYDAKEFIPKDDEKNLEQRQLRIGKELEARNLAETLVQSIENEIEKRSVFDKPIIKTDDYLEQIKIVDDEKLADDLTNRFETMIRKSLEDPQQLDSSKLGTSLYDDDPEKRSPRDSISISEDLTKDEESSPHEREESYPSSHAKMPDRDITTSPSSISEQIELEETMDVDTNDLTSTSPQSERRSHRSDRSSGHADGLQKETTLDDFRMYDEQVLPPISTSKKIEETFPDNLRSRQDSVDVPSLEMDIQKIYKQDIAEVSSFHESLAVDSLDKMVLQDRDITISPSTVSEITNVDDYYGLVIEPEPPRALSLASIPIERTEFEIGKKRADSFEIDSPPLVSPRLKKNDLMIKPGDWMIGEEKIEISEMLQPSQIFNQELEEYETSLRKNLGISVEDDVIQTTASSKTKFTVIPVSEHDYETELIENKLDISCQELVATLQREYEAKTPTEDYNDELIKQKQLESSFVSQKLEKKLSDESTKEMTLTLRDSSTLDDVKDKIPLEFEEKSKKDDPTRVLTSHIVKVKTSSEEQKRHVEKMIDKHERSAKPSTETCVFKIKKDDVTGADLSSRYAITVLDQVVKKEIAEVKESLEAAKQDLIEELNENSETVIQIKDSPSEFQFKLQPESIPNDLPFLYEAPSSEQMDANVQPTAKPRVDDGDNKMTKDEEQLIQIDVATSDIIDEESEDRPSPIPAIRSNSDIESKDDTSSSLAPPQPVPRKRQKPMRTIKKITSDSETDVGSSSGESSNYQSCDYESGSRPSSSDVEALQSAAGFGTSGTASEYETALMSIDHSSKPTSQDYHTAQSTLSSRESMKSLNSLSSGHLGSIDSTSEQLSETLVPSEADIDKDDEEDDADDENVDIALDEDLPGEHSESSGGSDIPVDDIKLDTIDSNIPFRMKRSSEMIFQQIVEDSATMAKEEGEITSPKLIESSVSVSMVESSGTVQSVDLMTSRVVDEDGNQCVSTQVNTNQNESKPIEKEQKHLIEMDSLELKSTEEENLEPQVPLSPILQQQQTSMSISSTSAISLDTVVGKSDRHSPDSDSFELVDKPDIMDDFVVIEEVGKEANELDSEGKSIRISSIPQSTGKTFDRDLENLITETKKEEKTEVPTTVDPKLQSQQQQPQRNSELFDFESEESPPQVSNNDEQFSQSYSDEEQYENGKKWMEMKFEAEARAYEIEYDRGPLEDIKEEEITDFEAGSSRFGSLGSQKESIGSVGSMRGSYGSTPDYDILSGKKCLTKPQEHDNISLSSLQEFENLENTVAAENSKKLQQCGSQDSVNNGSLSRRYVTSRSGHGDDISLSSLKDFEGLEKACREAHLIELRAREEEDLLEHESPENKYKIESMSSARSKIGSSGTGSINPSTSGSDDYERRIKEIDEIIRIAQSNVEKLDRQDDTTDDISQIEIMDVEKIVSQVPIRFSTDMESIQQFKDTNVMETSTDSLELEDNDDKGRNPLCRSSDSLEMKTTLDIPSLSSDSLNNVKDSRDAQQEFVDQQAFGNIRRISSDSLEMPLVEQQQQQQDQYVQNKETESIIIQQSSKILKQSSSADFNIEKNGKTASLNSGT